MQIAIMIEGQNGLNWPRWQRLARAVEDLGFAGLFRSDHFTNAQPPNLDSLELWVSLAWLATNTERLLFGPLVTPASFRDPVFTARMAKDVDALSNERLILGLGAGWQEREHRMFGYDLAKGSGRFRRFAESMEVITELLSGDPVTYDGDFYVLSEAQLLPPPSREGAPPILIGGNGERRTLPLAAKHADWWNALFIAPERFEALNAKLDKLLKARGRPPQAVKRTLMTGTRFARDEAELQRVLGGAEPDQLRERGLIVGTPVDFRKQLDRLAAAGVEMVMLQWLDLDDVDRLGAMAEVVL